MKDDPEELAGQLGAWIEAGNARACVDFFRGCGEKDRRRLAPVAKALSLQTLQGPVTGVDLRKVSRSRSVARLLRLATASEKEVRSHLLIHLPDDDDAEAACDVIADRWSAGSRGRDLLVQMIHEAQYHWGLSCALEARGIGPTPDDQARVAGFVWGTARGEAPLTDLLRSRPALHRIVWHFFDTPATGSLLATRDDHAKEKLQDALVVLASEGTLSRDRLLDGALEALAVGATGARWFATLLEQLAPSAAEEVARGESYLRLLAKDGGAAWDIALPAIERLLSRGALPADRVLRSAEGPLATQTKKNVLRFLRMLDATARSSPAGRSAAVMAACVGLRHAAPDIQRIALETIEKFGAPDDAALVARLAQEIHYLSPSNRNRLRAWLGEAGGSLQEAAPPEASVPVEGLVPRARALDPRWRALADVDDAVAAFEGGGALAPLVLRALEIPRLATDLNVVADLDALVDLALRAVEWQLDADDLERVIDGIARLARLRPEGFEARTAPLRHRCLEVAKEMDHGTMTGLPARPFSVNATARVDLLGVIAAWLDGEGDRPVTWSEPGLRWRPTQQEAEAATGHLALAAGRWASVSMFRSIRLAALAVRVGAGKVVPLLSTPTHRGGFIDPRVLVDRAVVAPGRNDRYDAIIALLRLAPEHRPEALEQARHLTGEYGAALRHALGGEGPVGKDAALWYAAARARSPFEDDTLVDERFPNGGPDAARAARYRIDPALFPKRERGAFHTLVRHPPSPVVVEPARHATPPQDGLPVLWHHHDATPFTCVGAWESSFWPLCHAALFAREAYQLTIFLESQGTYWKGDWEPLFDPDEPLDEPGLLLILLGAAARHPSHNKLAEDALAAGIDDGRIEPEPLGKVMGDVLKWDSITLARWTRALGEVAKMGPLHIDVVRRAVERALGEASPSPRSVAGLVELLHEWGVESGERVEHPATRGWLARIGGAGKTARLAKAVLAGPESSPAAHRQAVAAKRLALRIERAERWARVGAGSH